MVVARSSFLIKLLVMVATCLIMAGCKDEAGSGGELSSLLRKGQRQMQNGQYRDAVATYERATTAHPNAPEPYLRLAFIYEDCLHDPATALRYYRKYQQVEKDAVRKEEVEGWIAQLEESIHKAKSQNPNPVGPGTQPPETESPQSPSKTSAGDTDPLPSLAPGGTPSTKELQAKLASAMQEIRDLKAENLALSDLKKRLTDAEDKVKQLESEREALARSLEQARTDALRSQQTVRQVEEKQNALRNADQATIADLKKRLDAADRRILELEGSPKGKQISQLTKELQEARRQRDLAQAERTSAANEVARLNKAVNSYASTNSSLQKAYDELKKENATLRSQSKGQASRVRYHTVRRGETLKTIAGYPSVYGDSSKWVVIYQANKDKIRDPNKLTPGQVLIIPSG